MRHDDLKRANELARHLKFAESRLLGVMDYPGSPSISEDGFDPPDEMRERHRAEYTEWAKAEYAKALSEFKAL